MWQGTIQSYDGALQLLLIVDYIWSWARDVYRSTIRRVLSRRYREVSPASTDRHRHSVSLSCATSSAPQSQEQGSMELDETGIDPQSHVPLSDIDQPQPTQAPEISGSEDASLMLATFRRWSAGLPNLPSWTNLGSIRHSDDIQARFECHRTNRTGFYNLNANPIPSSNSEGSSSSTFLMNMEQIRQLSIMYNKVVPQLDFGGTVEVSFISHTFCDKSRWQIRRLLICLIWGPPHKQPDHGLFDTIDMPILQVRNNTHVSMTYMENALLHTLQIRGRKSVTSAFDAMKLTMTSRNDGKGVTWVPFDGSELPGNPPPNPFEDFSRIASSQAGLNDGNGWQLCFESTNDGIIHKIDPEPQDETPILAIRSPSESADGPQFCLFVLSREIDDSEGWLHLLLEKAISSKNFIGSPDFQWDRSTAQALTKWRKALVNEK
jgi:hypothetical protein